MIRREGLRLKSSEKWTFPPRATPPRKRSSTGPWRCFIPSGSTRRRNLSRKSSNTIRSAGWRTGESQSCRWGIPSRGRPTRPRSRRVRRPRAVAFEKAMEGVAAQYPQDVEARIFYALVLNVTALPTDKTFANQLKAAGILEPLFKQYPDHPGVAHYLIHTYDYAPLAEKGLPAARAYAGIAPSVPHALHMPSHLFSRVGLWREMGGGDFALPPAGLSWSKFPQAEAILVFARGLGAARSGDVAAARRDAERLRALKGAMTAAKIGYWAGQADFQIKTVDAWIAFAEKRHDDAVQSMRAAAEAEEASDKHPVTPGNVVPSRELLGEMLMALNQPQQAFAEFERSLKRDPNRFRGISGAARAAEASGNLPAARDYYAKLQTLTADRDRKS